MSQQQQTEALRKADDWLRQREPPIYLSIDEGALNGIDKAVVLLSYPKDAFGSKKALRAFICSDFGLSDGEILSHYTHRWKIEVTFKLQKMYMDLKSFVVRSAKAIDRLFVILPLAHFYSPF